MKYSMSSDDAQALVALLLTLADPEHELDCDEDAADQIESLLAELWLLRVLRNSDMVPATAISNQFAAVGLEQYLDLALEGLVDRDMLHLDEGLLDGEDVWHYWPADRCRFVTMGPCL